MNFNGSIENNMIWISTINRDRLHFPVKDTQKLINKLNELLVKANAPHSAMKWYMYTKKAVKNSTPVSYTSADRILLFDGDPTNIYSKKQMNAWKFDITANGLQGPISNLFLQKHDISDAKLKTYLKKAINNGSEPTGMITIDSFHKELSIQEVQNLI